MNPMNEAGGTIEKITVPESENGRRADAVIAGILVISRSAAEKLITAGNATRGGVVISKKTLLAAGDVIDIFVPEPESCEAVPEDIPLDIVYEDDDIIVVNKPSGMVVHPSPGHYTGTLVSALLWHCGDSLSGIGGVLRPGIVHRIDMETSGLICVAKNDAAHTVLAAQLEDHSMNREYFAIVIGGMRDDCGTVDAPIGRHQTDRKRMAVQRSGGKRAVTHYTVESRYTGFTSLALKLETGRTHQIRVHMSYIGHPVLGDPVYGGDGTAFERRHSGLFDGQCLHARALTLAHPRTGEIMRFEAPLPENIVRITELLEKL